MDKSNFVELENRFQELLVKPYKSTNEIIEKEKVRLSIEAALKEDEQDLVNELQNVGLSVSSVWDLVNTQNSYSRAIDILIKHLNIEHYEKNKEGIIRALTIKEAKGKVTLILRAEYDKTPKENYILRWVIANAIATTMTLRDVEWVILTVTDKSNGISRGQLVEALGTIKSERIEDILIKLVGDDDVALNAIVALGKLKSKKAKANILELINHPNKDIRQTAKKIIRKMI